MKLEEIKSIAKPYSITTNKLKNDELVRAIQRAEGYEQCYGAGKVTTCVHDNCLWRASCT